MTLELGDVQGHKAPVVGHAPPPEQASQSHDATGGSSSVGTDVDPFATMVHFLMSDMIEGNGNSVSLPSQEQAMNGLSTQLNDLSSLTGLLNKVRSDIIDGKSDSNAEYNMKNDINQLFTKLFGCNVGDPNQPWTQSTFEQFLSKTPPNGTIGHELFPNQADGSMNPSLKGIVNSFVSMAVAQPVPPGFGTSGETVSIFQTGGLSTAWTIADQGTVPGGEPGPGGNGSGSTPLPDAGFLRPITDSLGQATSLMQSTSSSTTSMLQYKQNFFNQTLSFLQTTLKSIVTQEKSFGQNMQSR